MSGGFVVNDTPTSSGAVTEAAMVDALSVAPLAGTWTDTEADGATIAVDEDGAVAVIPDGVAACAAYSTTPWPADEIYDVRAKLTITGTTNANVITYLIAAYGGSWVFFRCRGDGRIDIKHNIGGDTGLANVTGRPVDGTGELRFAVRGTRVTAWYRTGSAAWTLLYDGAVAGLAGLAAPTLLRVQGATEGGALGSQTTVTWSDVAIRSGLT